MDGHALILQPCHVKNDGEVRKTVEKDKSSTKLLVRNVAFEATQKDLRQLFSPFGQVITVKSDNLCQLFVNIRSFSFQNCYKMHLLPEWHTYSREYSESKAVQSLVYASNENVSE